MARVAITPSDDAIRTYHARLRDARDSADTQHEGNIRHAFANLLESTAKRRGWTLVQEHSVELRHWTTCHCICMLKRYSPT